MMLGEGSSWRRERGLVELSGLGYREMLKELRRRNVQFRYGEERFTEESRAAVE